MAVATNTTVVAAWESALAHFKSTSDAFANATDAQADAEDARDAAEIELLLTPSPDLESVTAKLRALWERNYCPTSGLRTDPYSMAQKLIVDDIDRLKAELR
jgi:hypothetical protein